MYYGQTMRSTSILALLLILLTACTSTPQFNTTGINTQLKANSEISKLDQASGERVIWGGVILSSHNLKHTTQLEILAYPLNSRYLPQTSQPPLGRYLLHQAGFLETSLYAAGRKLTAIGTLQKHKVGNVGEADYPYPVIEAEQLHLWSKNAGQTQTRFHFGLGVQL